LAEFAFLDTSLQSLVEEYIKHLIGSVDVVVGLDIFLECDTAVQHKRQSAMNFQDAGATCKQNMTRQKKILQVLTCFPVYL
jgi:hypothetical protein